MKIVCHIDDSHIYFSGVSMHADMNRKDYFCICKGTGLYYRAKPSNVSAIISAQSLIKWAFHWNAGMISKHECNRKGGIDTE